MQRAGLVLRACMCVLSNYSRGASCLCVAIAPENVSVIML